MSVIRAMMMEVVSISETSVYFYATRRRNISEDCLFILSAARA